MRVQRPSPDPPLTLSWPVLPGGEACSSSRIWCHIIIAARFSPSKTRGESCESTGRESHPLSVKLEKVRELPEAAAGLEPGASQHTHTPRQGGGGPVNQPLWPHFPHLWNGGGDTCSVVEGLHELIFATNLEQHLAHSNTTVNCFYCFIYCYDPPSLPPPHYMGNRSPKVCCSFQTWRGELGTKNISDSGL